MNSPQSQKESVGATVFRYTPKEMASTATAPMRWIL
jgi:hypothetical protein